MEFNFYTICRIALRYWTEEIGRAAPKLNELALDVLNDPAATEGAYKAMIERIAREGFWFATPKPKQKRKKRASEPKGLTECQTEAMETVAQCNGNIAQAARRLGKDPSTVKQHYRAALEKLGQSAMKRAKSQQLPTDSRGAEAVTNVDDKRARTRPVDRRLGD
jgi:DNA-binding NarL/FixJ family response regulator